MNCADRGFSHVYRGNLECLICHHPKPRRKNELGLPCIGKGCGRTLTPKNTYTVTTPGGREKLRCLACYARRQKKRDCALRNARHK